MLKRARLQKKLRTKRDEKRTLRAQRDKLRAKLKKLKKRAAEIAEEVQSSDVEETVEALEQEAEEIVDEVTELEDQVETLEEHISELDEVIEEIIEEIGAIEEEIPALDPEDDSIDPPGENENSKRGKRSRICLTARGVMRRGFFRDIDVQTRDRVMHAPETRGFLERMRAFGMQKRAVSGSQLTIPDVVLELLRDNLHRYSKLIGLVNLKPIPGTARQNVAGSIPEGVWTEMCATLNELEISFSQVEVDGYMVGGFIPIHNAILEDSDLNLASEILDSIGQALGLAIDKAILYGKGTKMPLGIATRLAQAAEPADWDAVAPKWKDLHTSNIRKLNAAGKTPEEFFVEMMLAMAAAKPNYAVDTSRFWAMNEMTHAKLLSKTISFNATGALVAAENNTIPIVGGQVVELPFIPDGDICGGYGSLYLLAERAGAQLEESSHVRFIQHQTVFKGTARYDGLPVIGEGFALLNIDNKAPTTTMDFAPDTANETQVPTP